MHKTTLHTPAVKWSSAQASLAGPDVDEEVDEIARRVHTGFGKALEVSVLPYSRFQ